MSSQAAIVGIEDHSASKAGLLGMTRCRALERGHHGQRDPADRGQHRHGRGRLGGEKGVKARAEIPVGRSAEPVEVALAALFPASGVAAMIDGSTLVADGGLTIP